MKIPSDLSHLLYILQSNRPSSNTRLVGGCVRDFILGKEPKDYDIVTDLHMEDVIGRLTKEGWKVDETGKQFLVLTVSSPKGNIYEIANYRKDGVYLDGRRPEAVEIGTIEEDARRRDFTVNAIYYNHKDSSIYSPIPSAISDLAARKLKFIGKPEERIKEDYLRVFRFYRFIQEKSFTPDIKSLKACRTHFEEAIKNTSGERIRNEIERMVKL